jgi:hypothetical protein
MVDSVNINTGLRIGFWNLSGGYLVDDWSKPFVCVGVYLGDPLGPHLPGSLIKQELDEGTLEFQVGILMGRRCQETILIIQAYVPEMFEYEDWEVLNY